MSTYSNLKIELIGTGEQDGTWGTTTNVNLGTALEEAIVGTVDQAVTASNLTLSLSDSNATQVARHLRLNLTGSAGGASNLIVPTLSGGKNYYIRNFSTTAITVKTSGGTGILVPAKDGADVKSMSLYQDGTNVVEAANYSVSYEIASVDINGGAIDGTTIGAASPSTGAFTTLSGISTGSVPSLEAKGTSGVTSGYLELNCSENSHAIKLLGPPHSASANYTLTFPNNDGDAGQFLQSNGSGVMSWAAASGTPFSTDIVVNDLTVGKGANSVATNTVLGDNALDAAVTGGFNTAVGYNALTTNTSGADNVAIGYDALATNADGSTNTAVGKSALKLNSSGGSNTAVGREALESNTSGGTNTAVGLQALGDNTTAGDSVAVGYLAAGAATTAAGTVAIGRETLGSGVMTGDYNTAVGYTAGKVITSGYQNTLMGYKAGLALTTGTSNVLIGDQAGDEQTGSLHNTVIGAEAGQKHTSGYSVMIGSQAGKNATSANELIAIGRGAGGGATMTGNYNILVGKNAGYAMTIGHSSTFVGNNSGDAITEGVKNQIFGFSSLPVATTPDGTCCFGGEALYNLTTGNTNDAFGQNALYSATIGYDNVAIGNAAGSAVTEGFRNTAVGHESGQVMTTGSNNTFLGYAAVPSSATVSNEMTLGNSSVATLRCQQTSISALSDARDKTDIVNSPYGLAFVDSLKPRQFKWESRDGKVANDGETKLGFIAQELLEATNGNNDVLDLVYENNPEKLEAKYGNLIPVLVKAVQELSAKVKELENK